MAGLPCPKSTTSFWHSEPSEYLLGHRTTVELPSHADVIIVGSGITGTSAARFLAEDERAKELKIVMLDAREACWGARGRVRFADAYMFNGQPLENPRYYKHLQQLTEPMLTEWGPLSASSL